MIHLEQPSYAQSLNDKTLKRMFVIAMNNEPNALYDSLPKKSGSLLANSVVDHIKPQLQEQLKQKSKLSILNVGLQDIALMLHFAFQDDGNVDEDLAQQVAKSIETTETVATLTLRHQEMMRSHIVSENRQNNFYISHEDKSLKVGDGLPSSARIPYGCPYAGKRDNGEIGEIDPIFKRFVPWAGTLAVRRYFDPAFKQIYDRVLFS